MITTAYKKKKKKKEKKKAYLINTRYENMPIQIYRKFLLQKLKNFRYKNCVIFHISARNMDCGYSLEPPLLET